MRTDVISPKIPLFWKCAAFSFVAHALCLTLLYQNPLLLKQVKTSLFGISSPELKELELEELFVEENDKQMQEVFEQIVFLSSYQQSPFDLRDLPKGIALAPKEEVLTAKMKEKLPSSDAFEKTHRFHGDMAFTAFPSKEFDVEAIKEEKSLMLFPSLQEITSITAQLQMGALHPLLEIGAIPFDPLVSIEENVVAFTDVSLVPEKEEEGTINTHALIAKENEVVIKTDQLPLSGVLQPDLSFLQKEEGPHRLFQSTKKPNASSPALSLDSLASCVEPLHDLPLPIAATWNDDFDVEVRFVPNPEEEGYLFSVALSPKKEMGQLTLRQNLYFVLDRSHDIPKHRFSVFKRAVLKALHSMQASDTFNILVIDKKISAFQKQNLNASLKNIQAAEEFLNKQEAGGVWANGEIYSSLKNTLDFIKDDDEMHTLILLTDGKTHLTTERKQKVLKNWLDMSRSKAALYTAAVGNDNDLVTLDLISSVSGGSLLYSDTHASFPRKLAKLILDLKHPLAKEVVIEAVPKDSKAKIEFYTAGTHLPALFSHHPYVVYGKINQLSSFDFVLQGRNRNAWIAIRKEIAFTEEKTADRELVSSLGSHLANLCYSNFLKEGKSTHLKEAKEILKKTRTTLSLE